MIVRKGTKDVLYTAGASRERRTPAHGESASSQRTSPRHRKETYGKVGRLLQDCHEAKVVSLRPVERPREARTKLHAYEPRHRTHHRPAERDELGNRLGCGGLGEFEDDFEWEAGRQLQTGKYEAREMRSRARGRAIGGTGGLTDVVDDHDAMWLGW